MKPVVDRLQGEYSGKVDFFVYGEVNSDPAASEVANQHGVTAIPTMMFVAADGSELDRIVGSRPESDLRARLDAGQPREARAHGVRAEAGQAGELRRSPDSAACGSAPRA